MVTYWIKDREEKFFFSLDFLSRTFTNHRTIGEGGISLTPHYHFHPLHRHLDINRAITAESCTSLAARLEPETCKSLTTKLRALIRIALKGRSSACKKNLAHVAQGSALGPTLFFLRIWFYIEFILKISADNTSFFSKV